ncbi:GNAT family N-acetyltransferase [Nocardia sp. MDA0666]|uniref:GNAT family N-acetyltransferase n=1 Tax=Nocardia sp. MDA0666 TaxID=2135448 RepID=UPI000D116519|nr:GNAT family N-acetyltransferase [Nocardia sp. MDA0666]PSR65785.1 GNAT family N-acetyltransferase [Nocardia sp. MDA0666]
MRIAAARAEYFDGLSALVVAFYAEGGFTTPESVLRRNLLSLNGSDTARVCVADNDGRLLGFAVTTTSFGLEHGLIAELEDLYVIPAARRRGVATALIDDSATWARTRGCHHLELVIAPTSRDAAHLDSYYRSRGFRDDGRRLLTREL